MPSTGRWAHRIALPTAGWGSGGGQGRRELRGSSAKPSLLDSFRSTAKERKEEEFLEGKVLQRRLFNRIRVMKMSSSLLIDSEHHHSVEN